MSRLDPLGVFNLRQHVQRASSAARSRLADEAIHWSGGLELGDKVELLF